MADNTATAEKQVKGHRKAIEEHIKKWREYPAKQDKDTALKTIANAQNQIAKHLKAHPSIKSDTPDTWKP
jgi:gas vesicle protein